MSNTAASSARWLRKRRGVVAAPPGWRCRQGGGSRGVPISPGASCSSCTMARSPRLPGGHNPGELSAVHPVLTTKPGGGGGTAQKLILDVITGRKSTMLVYSQGCAVQNVRRNTT